MEAFNVIEISLQISLKNQNFGRNILHVSRFRTLFAIFPFQGTAHARAEERGGRGGILKMQLNKKCNRITNIFAIIDDIFSDKKDTSQQNPKAYQVLKNYCPTLQARSQTVQKRREGAKRS